MIVGAEGIVGADSYGHGGMSLRDYFAAHWQPSDRDIDFATRHGDTDAGHYYVVLANMAYAYADAMIRVRSSTAKEGQE